MSLFKSLNRFPRSGDDHESAKTSKYYGNIKEIFLNIFEYFRLFSIILNISCTYSSRSGISKYYGNINEILQKYYRNITEILQKYYL